MKFGIDVSDNNGPIDWDAIKAAGVEFAMIRTGYGSNYESQDDKQAIRNMQECERLGIPYGTYNYSYALNNDEAISEAEHALRMAKGFNPILGIYTDMEDADGYKARHNLEPESNGSALTDFCIITMDAIIAAGYNSGTYANKNYFTNIMQLDKLNNYPKWLALWGPTDCPSGDWEIWQNSSDGMIPGSSSRTDTNYYIKDFPAVNNPVIDNIDYPIIPERPIDSPANTYKVGDHVNYNSIYYESGAWEAMNPTFYDGVIIHIYEGSRNPYLVDHNNGVGIGFLNDACITGNYSDIEPAQVDPQPVDVEPSINHSVGDTVIFDALFVSSCDDNALTPAVTSGVITQINEGAANPYLINDGTGWTNDAHVIDGSALAETYIFNTGDQVKVNEGACDIYGTQLADFVYQNVYDVIVRNEDIVKIGKSGSITAVMSASDLYLA